MNKTCPWCSSENTDVHIELNDYFLTQEHFVIRACSECGLLYTDPVPSPEKIGDYYKSVDYYSHKENKNGIIPRLYESVKKVNLRHKVRIVTQGLSPGTLLDIGCGVGDFLHQMEGIGWQVTGVEPSDEASLIAKSRMKGPVYKPDEIGGLPDKSFHVITLWHVLEHVDNLIVEIDHLSRLLKDGGRLIVAVPNYKSYDANYYQNMWAAYDVPRHLFHFDKPTLNHLFAGKGFSMCRVDKLRWDAYYVSFMSEKYLQHKAPLLRGVWRGFVSNCSARSTGEWSSMVYVFSK